MQRSAATYRFASESQTRRALTRLGESFATGPARTVSRRMTYLDTFDWRVYRNGSRLAVAHEDRQTCLLWRPPDEEGFSRCPVEAVPQFAWDLPPGPVRERIESVVGVRRMLPQVEIELSGRAWDVLDRRRKVVVGLLLESGSASNPDASAVARKLGVALRVIPVRGYSDEFERVRGLLEPCALERDDACLLDRALSALGRRPHEPFAKTPHDLRASMRADSAMKAVHLRLLQSMLRNEDGLRRNVDSEFLHDFRVAGRRTRSGLAQVPGVFTAAVVERFRKGFAWLGRETGALRDLDVYLLALPRYRDWLAQDLRGGFDPIEHHLRRRHAAEHRRVVVALGSARYGRLIEAWRAHLETGAPRRTSLPNAARPILGVATERIRRAHRRVLKKGRAIDAESPPRRLHRLRIECKKLRYLLEFFRVLYPSGEVASLIGALKKLQDNLGDFNDFSVQRRTLVGFADQLSSVNGGTDETREALKQVQRHLKKRQAATREEFQSRFDAFSGPEVAAMFQRLLGDPTR